MHKGLWGRKSSVSRSDNCACRFVWWEAVDLLRKATLVGAVTCFRSGTITQAYLASLLALAWLLIQVKHTQRIAI